MTMQTLPMTTGQTMVALGPPPQVQTSFPIRVPQPAHTHTPAAAVGRSGAAFSPLIPLAGIQVQKKLKM